MRRLFADKLAVATAVVVIVMAVVFALLRTADNEDEHDMPYCTDSKQDPRAPRVQRDEQPESEARSPCSAR